MAVMKGISATAISPLWQRKTSKNWKESRVKNGQKATYQQLKNSSFSLTSLPPYLLNFKDLKCSTFLRVVLKRERQLFQRSKNYLNRISKLQYTVAIDKRENLYRPLIYTELLVLDENFFI